MQSLKMFQKAPFLLLLPARSFICVCVFNINIVVVVAILSKKKKHIKPTVTRTIVVVLSHPGLK